MVSQPCRHPSAVTATKNCSNEIRPPLTQHSVCTGFHRIKSAADCLINGCDLRQPSTESREGTRSRLVNSNRTDRTLRIKPKLPRIKTCLFSNCCLADRERHRPVQASLLRIPWPQLVGWSTVWIHISFRPSFVDLQEDGTANAGLFLTRGSRGLTTYEQPLFCSLKNRNPLIWVPVTRMVPGKGRR
jgi:hypothetical protein